MQRYLASMEGAGSFLMTNSEAIAIAHPEANSPNAPENYETCSLQPRCAAVEVPVAARKAGLCYQL